MKKLLLLLLLCPLAAMAEFYPGTVNFNDGTIKKGFIELPETAEQSDLNFRLTKDGDTEKLEIEDVKGFTITDQPKHKITYVTLRVGEPKLIKKNDISKEKSWLRLNVKGKINIVTAYYYKAGRGGGQSSSGYNFYFWKPGDDYCSFFYSDISYSTTLSDDNFETLKKGIESNFSTDCPKLAENLKKQDLKKNWTTAIVRLYEKTCGKQSPLKR